MVAIRAITRIQDADDYTGTPSDGQVLTYVGADSKFEPKAASGGAGGLGVYGDGSDGTVTLDGTTSFSAFSSLSGSNYTLTRDVFFAALTINSGVQVITAGFRIFCAGAFTNNGTIQWNGNNGGNGTTSPGAAGAVLINASSTIGQGNPGAAGGAGSLTTGAGGSNNTATGLGGAGGHGGAGSSAGGAGGATTLSATQGQLRALPFAGLGLFVSGAASFSTWKGGAGGGGGGGDGTNAGGGGGSGGGVIEIWAKTFAGTGSITCTGGNGGNGNTTGNTGGGGPGGGGSILIGSSSVSGGAISGQTITAAGGAQGTSHGTGGSGITNGVAGTIILLAN